MRALAATLSLLTLPAAQAPPPAIDGRWVNPSGSVIIDIARCGEVRCGTVKWASEKAQADARKGTEQLVGSDLLTGLREKKAGQWQGRIFVPDQKLRVTAKIELLGDQHLRVAGCALGKRLCKSQLWSRSDQPLPSTQ